MDEEFIIYVFYRDKELGFPAQLRTYGFSYKIEVNVDGTNVFFEPDDERNWRALISYEELEQNKSVDKELLKSIAMEIEELVK